MIIPSIDLMNGKAVQLKQGREKVLEKENVLELAKEFSKFGEIALIDLDAALGQGNNFELIKEICRIADCRVGGGIRTKEKADELFQAGAKKIIIGTRAEPGFLQMFPKKRIIVAIDSKDNFVVSNGWTKKSKKTPRQVIKELENYCEEFLFTNVKKEGLMQGADMERILEFKGITKNNLTLAGGISSFEEIKQLENIGVNSQIGMALYTDKIKLSQVFVSLVDFQKTNGLVPTITQDEKNQVLMLGFSSKESLLETFQTGKATYFSRSKNRLWTKGETSGNFQELIKARYDCDRDALLFTVKQKNFACHLGKYSCFGEKEFCLEELYSVLLDRIENPKKSSYTSKIAKDEKMIKEKIDEECKELLNFKDRKNLVWEIADLAYFVIVLMAKNSVSIKDVKNELWRRRK